jgi:hypothetical protein
MILSRRSLIVGAGAAIITRPALAAPLAPILGGNPLAFPGGLAGFNAAHPMAKGARFSGVARGANITGAGFINLLTGATGVPNGTNGQIISALIGPAAGYSGSVSQHTFGGNPAIVDTNATIAGIFILNSGSSGQYHGIMQTSSTGAGWQLFPTQTTGYLILQASGVGTYSSTLAAALGVPYLAVGSTNSVGANFLLLRLDTGVLQTQFVSGSHTSTASNGTYIIGGLTGNVSLYGYLAAVAFSAQYMSLPQLISAFTPNPWSYWYPPTLAQTIFNGLASRASAPTSNVNGLFLNGIMQ